MWIIGCDYHPRFQRIAVVNTETGEMEKHRLEHGNGEAEQFYRRLQGQQVRVGVEASGPGLWFERLLAELGHELWKGDAAKMRAAAVRQQKTDDRDALHWLQLMQENRFPQVRRPSLEERDQRQLGLHRHRLVQICTRIKNQLQALAMNENLCPKSKLWSQAGRAQFEALPLPAWTARRRQELLELHDQLTTRLDPLDRAVWEQASARAEVRRLMPHPGIGQVTALAYVRTRGEPTRFECGKQVASYLGLILSEDSRGGRQRLGHISKPGNALLRGC